MKSRTLPRALSITFVLCLSLLTTLTKGSLSVPELSAEDHVSRASFDAAGDEVLFYQQEALSENVELVGQIGGPVRGLALQGTHAYIGEGRYLVALDVSDPTNPTPIGKSVALPGLIQDVVVKGDYAYVIIGGTGLHVMDISDPAAPHEVGAYDVGSARSIHVDGSLAYIVGGPMWILDISNPANPIEIGFYEPRRYGRAYDVYVVGDYAYVAEYDSLQVLDVSDPTAPIEVGAVETGLLGLGPSARSVFVAGDYAYLAYGDGYKASEWGGLVVIDVSDPTTPAKVGHYGDDYGECYAWDVFVAYDYAYLTSCGLLVLDISDPENLSAVGHTAGGRNVLISQDHAYVNGEGLSVIDISDPTVPILVGSYNNTLPSARDVFVVGDYAYVVSGGVWLVNVSNPAAPRKIGTCCWSVQDVMVVGGYAYVGWGSYNPWANEEEGGFRVVDVSDPTAPAEVGAYGSGYYTRDVFVAEGYAYLAEVKAEINTPDKQSGLRVMDVSDPTELVEVARYDLPGDLRGAADVFVAGDYAYVAVENLYVVDISDPAAPTAAGVYETPGVAVEVYVSGSMAYVADSGGGLRMIDVSNPAELVEMEFFNTPGDTKGVYVDDDYAYVADAEAGLRVIDVLDPTAPIEVGFYDTPGDAQGVFVAGGYVYVADGDGGLVILRYTGGPACSIDTGGRVGIEDMRTVAGHWHERNTLMTDIRRFDLDEDGVITVRDVLLVGRQMGQRCP